MIIKAATVLFLIGTGWIAVLATVMVLSDASPAALVLFPGDEFLSHLPDGTSILGKSWFSVTLADPTPGFSKGLYRAGALLVLPAGLKGCSLS